MLFRSVGLLGYCAINDGINTYQKLQSAEAAFAPIVARAEDLSRVRYLVSLARDTLAQNRYDSEMWAGLLRLDNRCVCDERLLRGWEDARVMDKVLASAEQQIDARQFGIRVAINRYQMNTTQPLEERLQFDGLLGAVMIIGAVISKIRKRNVEELHR